MKAIVSTGALALALALGGCGDGGDGNTSSGTAGTGTGTTAAAVPAPNGGDWSQTVTQTAEGGFLMGNPDAQVKIVEFASMTCPHCAEFSETGVPALTEKYIKTGQASLEFRNFVRDPADLAASLLARCGGPTPFFKLSDQIFAAQEEWIGKLQAMTPAQMQALQSVPPQQAVATMADSAGLIDFVRVRGIPTEKARQCLGNQEELNKLVAMQQKITTDHPDFPGTPSFLINGELAQNTSNWAALEPKIAEALR